MKKLFHACIVLVVMLSLTVGSALAANGLLTLVSVQNNAGGGVLFIFDFSGDFKKSDFQGGFAYFGDRKFPIDCNIVDEDTVQCSTSRAVAGQNIQINLAGSIFWAFVPETPEPSIPYCYGVFELGISRSFPTDVEPLGFLPEWQRVAEHCKENPAIFGELLQNYPSVNFPGLFGEYEFLPESPKDTGCAFADVSDDAYYLKVKCIIV